MLLQSHEKRIHILPALPPEWKEGKVNGLRARGGIFVGIEWKNSQVKVTLLSSRDQEAKVQIAGDEAVNVRLEGNKELELFCPLNF